MKVLQAISAALVLAAVSMGTNSTASLTIIRTAFTTYCPEPTKFAVGNVTYTVTKPTTLTITNCPCTLTKTGVTSLNPTTPSPPQTKKPTTPSLVPLHTNTTRPSAQSTKAFPIPTTSKPPVTAAAQKQNPGLSVVAMAGFAAMLF
ncbi:hypothetical protein VFPPC_15019 [Pochonia chlamydosporia 170]|uniref:Mmc protein n=1 Tax=Pochonia chlamydosporia 170 TaxID=1380566 RepID=A0A179EWE4_METCM|nr:hypothetical protein VFPPC_15019 [Pochonia chlamydosporia 170]OAQ57525.1 hypothetical protein VFPPC_15019 [Pochonia chlamydosporia 170]